jgi:predicted MFS family arabinose efflux permease
MPRRGCVVTLERPDERFNGHGLIPALGVAQIVSWGTLYYAIAVLGAAMRAELGVSQPVLFGAFTAGMFMSGLFAPWAGRQIDHSGGRMVLSAGSILAATSMALLAVSRGPWSMALGWLLAGAAMAFTLYDPAFATLHRLRPETYRRAVTALTLFGGFASTVFWPLSNVLQESIGWRGAFACYALLHLLLCLPLHWIFLPKEAVADPAPHNEQKPPAAVAGNATFYWLAAAFALASFLVGGLAVHLIDLLRSGGLTAAEAVLIGACIGPMQVAGRILEFAFARRTRAIHVGYGAFALMVAALMLLAFIGNHLALGILFAALYGMANGILTIVRGVAPPEILGGTGMGALLGKLGRPAMFAKALAPVSIAVLLSGGYLNGRVTLLLVAVALIATVCFAAAASRRADDRKG